MLTGKWYVGTDENCWSTGSSPTVRHSLMLFSAKTLLSRIDFIGNIFLQILVDVEWLGSLHETIFFHSAFTPKTTVCLTSLLFTAAVTLIHFRQQVQWTLGCHYIVQTLHSMYDTIITIIIQTVQRLEMTSVTVFGRITSVAIPKLLTSNNLLRTNVICAALTLFSCSHRRWTYHGSLYFSSRWLVGWLEFNVPFQHKYGYIRDKRSGVDSYPLTQWRKASDILTWTLGAFLFSSHPKKETDREAHLN